MTDSMVDLNLATLGELNTECAALIPSLVRCLNDSKTKSKLTITIEFKRLEDSDTAIVVGYAVKPVYPKKAQKMLCRTDLVGNLRTEALPQSQQLSILHPVKEE